MVNLGLELSDDVDNSQTRVAQCDPIINRTSIYHPDGHNPPPEAAGEMPGRFVAAILKSGGAIFKSVSPKIKLGADTLR